jgi:predicted phosphodiesterase
MDDAELKATLPLERVVEVEGAPIGMVHIPGPARGRAARLRATFPNCDAIVYGHTHVPEAVRDGGVWILNPGSPTERRRAPARAMLLLHVEDGTLAPEPVVLT